MFICNHCDKEFPSSVALRGHSRIHGTSFGKVHQLICCCVLTKKVIQAKHLERFQNNLKRCKHCDRLLDSNRKFCNRSCAASFNNIDRINNGYVVSEDHKKKTSATLKQKYGNKEHSCDSSQKKNVKQSYTIKRPECSNKNTNSRLPKKHKVIGPYSKIFTVNCHHCHFVFLSRKKLKYCFGCKSKYSESAKSGYKFTFNVYNYPDLFDLSLVQKHGWFAPGGKAKRWNINGVSRDHKVSVNEAIRNDYDPYYISHPLNCEIMLHSLNDKKKHHSSISYAELVKRVDEYEASKLPGLGSNQHIAPFGLSE
jgi:hypothetical protein